MHIDKTIRDLNLYKNANVKVTQQVSKNINKSRGY